MLFPLPSLSGLDAVPWYQGTHTVTHVPYFYPIAMTPYNNRPSCGLVRTIIGSLSTLSHTVTLNICTQSSDLRNYWRASLCRGGASPLEGLAGGPFLVAELGLW